VSDTPSIGDAKRVVAEGYDRIADRYNAWASTVREAERARYTAVLLEGLPPGAQVLELGCGSGLPTTQHLAERFAVTGVDISEAQITCARHNVPSAVFVHGDMTELDFAPGTFDAVAAFYSLIHLPRDEQPALLRRIAGWLRPGGLLVATMGAQPIAEGVEEDWLGAPMYWSSFDADTNRSLIEQAGLELLSAREETAEEFGEPVTFLWVIAQKPEGALMSPQNMDDICNYLRISESLGTAGQPTSDQFADIRAVGYEVVINLAMPTSTNALPNERELVTGLGMDYLHIPVVWEAPTLSDLARFFQAMDENWHRRVFVHCALNMRVSVFVLLYRILRLGVPLEIASEALERIWHPNPVWQAFIDEALAKWDEVKAP
jgi:SAM-dependent methyltransferase/protein tyrosine phosphatase (PTP) superfamily phosphohydrolase (DUF442 family)